MFAIEVRGDNDARPWPSTWIAGVFSRAEDAHAFRSGIHVADGSPVPDLRLCEIPQVGYPVFLVETTEAFQFVSRSELVALVAGIEPREGYEGIYLNVYLIQEDYKPDPPGTDAIGTVPHIHVDTDFLRAYIPGDFNWYCADLRGANLREANLERAHLTETDLRGADLQGANLERARLTETDLEGANLHGANLQGAHIAGNLQRADLSGADLRRACLREVNLERADLSGANLRGANLGGTMLRGANLKDVILTGAVYDARTRWPRGFDAQQAGAIRCGRRADLHGAQLEGANLMSLNLAGANLAGADLKDADLGNTDLSRAHLVGTRLTGANLRAYLRSANLEGADLSGLDLQAASLKGANLRNAKLDQADLRWVDLTSADLRGATLVGARYDESTSWPARFDPEAHGARRVTPPSPGEPSIGGALEHFNERTPSWLRVP